MTPPPTATILTVLGRTPLLPAGPFALESEAWRLFLLLDMSSNSRLRFHGEGDYLVVVVPPLSY